MSTLSQVSTLTPSSLTTFAPHGLEYLFECTLRNLYPLFYAAKKPVLDVCSYYSPCGGS